MESRKRHSTTRTRKDAESGKVRSRNRRTVFWMVAFLVVLGAFISGFVVRSNVPLMTSLGIVSGSEDTMGSINASASKNDYEILSKRLDEAEQLLANNSLDNIDLDGATNEMLEKLVSATEDSYAEYFTPERYDTYLQENANNSFSGVGVLFGEHEGRAYAIDVLEGSQAQAEGVQQGDFVIAIDGDSEHAWSASEVIGALSRDEGQSVVVKWMRPLSLDASTGHEFTTTLKCHQSKFRNVTYRMRGDVGYIRLRQITGNSAELVKSAVQDLDSQGAKAFVLNICDNPGGYLTQSLDIASLFVPSGVLVGIETVDGVNTRNASGATETAAPLVVMVNSYTSGVAEVLAAALKDNSRATIVGQRTTGKGSVQVTRELGFGGAIRYTAAYYLTPTGQQINGVGVVPDIEVADEGKKGGQGVPLQVAIDCANSLIKD